MLRLRDDHARDAHLASRGDVHDLCANPYCLHPRTWHHRDGECMSCGRRCRSFEPRDDRAIRTRLAHELGREALAARPLLDARSRLHPPARVGRLAPALDRLARPSVPLRGRHAVPAVDLESRRRPRRAVAVVTARAVLQGVRDLARWRWLLAGMGDRRALRAALSLDELPRVGAAQAANPRVDGERPGGPLGQRETAQSGSHSRPRPVKAARSLLSFGSRVW